MADERLKIVSDGTPGGTKVLLIATSANGLIHDLPLSDVVAVSWAIRVDERATAVVEFRNVEVEVEADTPQPVDTTPAGLNQESLFAEEEGGTIGGVVVPSRSGETSVVSGSTKRKKNSEKDLRSDVTDDERRVHEEWVELFEPRNGSLTPSRLRIIRKGLAEASVDECLLALQGLKSYRDAGHPGKVELSTVFATYPGSSPLRERIDFWIDQAQTGTIAGAGFPSAPPAKVLAAKRDVLMAHSMEGSEMAHRKGEESEAWLRQHGIETVLPGHPRYPEGGKGPHFIALVKA